MLARSAQIAALDGTVVGTVTCQRAQRRGSERPRAKTRTCPCPCSAHVPRCEKLSSFQHAEYAVRARGDLAATASARRSTVAFWRNGGDTRHHCLTALCGIRRLGGRAVLNSKLTAAFMNRVGDLASQRRRPGGTPREYFITLCLNAKVQYIVSQPNHDSRRALCKRRQQTATHTLSIVSSLDCDPRANKNKIQSRGRSESQEHKAGRSSTI